MRDETDGDGLLEDAATLPPSLLPYEQWIEQAYRQVMIKALTHAESNGLPGEHHFYVTFRTTARGVQIPTRLLSQYPQEMTIVLQHQFWDLKVNHDAGTMSVGLSFGSVPSTLVIPFAAVSGFADPQVRLVLRFTVTDEDQTQAGARPERLAAAPAALQPQEPPNEPESEPQSEEPAPQVVSLDAFRRRGPSQD